VSGQLHAPAVLPPGKSPWYPFYRRLGGPQNRSGRYREVKFFYPTGTRTPTPHSRPARSQSLYRLSYPGSPLYGWYWKSSSFEHSFDKFVAMAMPFVVCLVVLTFITQVARQELTDIHAESSSLFLFVGCCLLVFHLSPRRHSLCCQLYNGYSKWVVSHENHVSFR
jgi:hypothetical protein